MKSSSQTALKVLSIILIVFAVLMLILGILSIAGSALLGTAGNTSEAVAVGTLGAIAGVIILIGGIIYLIIGILGMRGANDPQKIGPFYVLTIIGLILSIIGLISNFALGTDASTIGSSLVGLIIILVCFLLARNIKQQAQ